MRTKPRSRNGSTPKKIKFSDDGETSVPVPAKASQPSATKESKSETKESNSKAEEPEGETGSPEIEDKEPESEAEKSESDDSDSDSDSDEAPEEESISASRAKTLEQQRLKEQQAQELKRQEKQKRKEQDLLFQQQQQEKKKRKEEELIYKQKQQEKKKRLEKMSKSTELPDLLPDDLIASVSQQKNGSQAQGKHMRSEDLEEEYAAMKKKAKLEKLKQLKQQRTSAVKKGPVHVQVQTFGEKKKIVPRADPKVIESKTSWLNRDSLRRK